MDGRIDGSHGGVSHPDVSLFQTSLTNFKMELVKLYRPRCKFPPQQRNINPRLLTRLSGPNNKNGDEHGHKQLNKSR